MKKSDKRMLVLGLNEFNQDLLRTAAGDFALKNIQKMMSMRETATKTDDTYESDFLEPWVQWVSVHTGKVSTEHKIKHLGDVPQLSSPQIWDELGRKGITSGVWGAMNAGRNNAEKCLFFLPDPWTFSEGAYPEELGKILDLPRYVAKNYLNLSKAKAARKFFRLLGFLASSKVCFSLLGELPSLLKNIVKYKGRHFVFISFADYILTCLFLEYYEKFSPRFGFIFLNSLAHIQHHHWYGVNYKENAQLKLGLTYIDKLLGKLMAQVDEKDSFVCLNALSQKNTNEETPWILYRQKDQQKFLKEAGVNYLRVEPHMTHDAHIFFETRQACLAAQKILEAATVQGKRLFLVESYSSNNRKLFYRIDFTDQIDSDAILDINGKSYPFFDLFTAIVRRTGKHIPVGTIYSKNLDIPDSIYNHELFGHILKFFEKPRQKSAAAQSTRNLNATVSH